MLTPNKAKFHIPSSWIISLCMLSFAFIGAGVWLTMDFLRSRDSIIAERTALAVQTSKFMSQWFGTTITNTDYVLRDITTRVTQTELDLARSDPKTQKRLSNLVREKLATLVGVYGLGFIDEKYVFIAAADEKVVGIKTNSKLRADRTPVLENRTYIEYVPVAKSANKQPAILVSRPILSPEGKFMGGALAAIMLTRAQSWMETFKVQEHDTIEMLDDDGILLAANPPNLSVITKALRYPRAQPEPGDRGGSTSFIAVSPADGRERIYGVSRIEGIPLTIIVGFDKAQVLRDWQHRVWQFLAGFITLVFLSGLILYKHLVVLAQRDELAKAISEIRVLSGLLPICAWCKCVRDDTGYWQQIESYVSLHSEASFTHGICPKCAAKIKQENAQSAAGT